MSRVLVTDASERAALAVIRSLGRKGIEVAAADSVGLNAGFLSKYCSDAFIYPSPLKDKTKFVKSMLRFVRDEKFDLLIPITDFTMVPIVECKDEFEDYVKVAAPSYETAIKALDKVQTIRIAEKCGVPCPRTFIIDDVKVLKEVADDFRYPLVIKPRMKVFWKRERGIILKVTPRNYAYNSRDLIDKYVKIISQLSKIHVPSDFFMIQEFIEGEAYGVEALMYRGELKAIFMHKRLREYPVTGGASTLRISIRDERLAKYAVKLLKEMNWRGVAMVEFKMNPYNGDVRLMEVNGRFWGSLSLALNAGVDFPYLMYKLNLKEDVDSCCRYKIGVMQKWLLPGDLLWLYSSIKNGKENRLRCLIKFLASLHVADDIISLNDFCPTLGAIVSVLRGFSDVVKGTKTIYGEAVV